VSTTSEGPGWGKPFAWIRRTLLNADKYDAMDVMRAYRLTLRPYNRCVGEYKEARRIAQEFHDREYDFAIDERKIRFLLGAGSKKKALASEVFKRFSKNGRP
jgi:hypothetical protein